MAAESSARRQKYGEKTHQRSSVKVLRFYIDAHPGKLLLQLFSCLVTGVRKEEESLVLVQ
jgi:hypothetical protein